LSLINDINIKSDKENWHKAVKKELQAIRVNKTWTWIYQMEKESIIKEYVVRIK